MDNHHFPLCWKSLSAALAFTILRNIGNVTLLVPYGSSQWIHIGHVCFISLNMIIFVIAYGKFSVSSEKGFTAGLKESQG